MVSLAVSYNARDILLKARKEKKNLYFLQYGDLFSVWCFVFCGCKEHCFKLEYFETVLQKPGGPVRQGNLSATSHIGGQLGIAH